MYTKCPGGNKENSVLLLFYFLNCVLGTWYSMYYSLYLAVYFKYFIFLISSNQKNKKKKKEEEEEEEEEEKKERERKFCWKPRLFSLEFWQPELLFPGVSFPTKGNIPQHAHEVIKQRYLKVTQQEMRGPFTQT